MAAPKVIFYRREKDAAKAKAIAEAKDIKPAFRNLEYYAGEVEAFSSVLLLGDNQALVSAYEKAGAEVSIVEAPKAKPKAK